MFFYVAVAILAIVGFTVVFNVIKGVTRGLGKTLGTLIAIVVSAIIAFVVTSIVCNPSSPVLVTVFDAVKGILPPDIAEELLTVESLGTAFTSYASMVIAPIFFTLSFTVISLVLAIVAAIIAKIILRKRSAPKRRVAGLLVGLACGLISAIIFVMPAVGYIDLAASAKDVVDIEAADGSHPLTDAANSKVIDICLAAGCGSLCNHFSSTKFEGEKVYLKDDISSVIAIIEDVEMLSGDMSGYSEEQIAALRDIVSKLDGSPILRVTVADIVANMAGKWAVGGRAFGIERPSAGELVTPLLDELFDILSTTDKNTITGDLNAFVDIFEVVVEYEMLSSETDMVEVIKSTDAVSELMSAIKKNERMAPLSNTIKDIGVKAMLASISVPSGSGDSSSDGDLALDLPLGEDINYGEALTDITDVINESANMTEEEREEFIADELANVAENYGVTVDEEKLADIASGLSEELGNLGDLENYGSMTEEEIIALLMQHAASMGQ